MHPGFVKSEMTEKNAFPMPFLLEVDDAARRMADAIEKKQPWLQFPTPLVAGMGVVSMLPRGVRRSLLGAGAGKGK